MGPDVHLPFFSGSVAMMTRPGFVLCRCHAGKCVCRPGSFSPCLPTDTVCSWGDQPICVGSAEFFGVPACTFVGALQKHLPRVQCPY